MRAPCRLPRSSATSSPLVSRGLTRPAGQGADLGEARHHGRRAGAGAAAHACSDEHLRGINGKGFEGGGVAGMRVERRAAADKARGCAAVRHRQVVPLQRVRHVCSKKCTPAAPLPTTARTMSAPCTAVPISWWLSCAASSPSSGLPPVPAGRGLEEGGSAQVASERGRACGRTCGVVRRVCAQCAIGLRGVLPGKQGRRLRQHHAPGRDNSPFQPSAGPALKRRAAPAAAGTHPGRGSAASRSAACSAPGGSPAPAHRC